MKVLIVDDNKNNRMILRLLLEDYTEDNNLEDFEISEAEDGLVALNMCKEESFSLILMDIMMPNMDGIEATKEIRKIDSKAMIIAVSAVDDSERKKLILSNGAEDYISKPVNADIFVNRIANYLVLIDARNHAKQNKRNINLFTEKIYNRHVNFMVDSEDSLSEFWEYYLLTDSGKCDGLSDVIRTLFSIADTQVRLSIESNIYAEESEDKKYFTITNLDKLPPKVVELLIKKNNLLEEYKLSEERLTIALEYSLELENNILESTPLGAEVMNNETVVEVQESVEEIASPISFESSKALAVFDYMEDEDLYDLEDYAGKLNSIMLVVGNGGVTEEEVIEIYGYLDRLGSILSTYSEVYSISQALTVLSQDMSAHINDFIENSEALGPMCKAFSNDMSSWIEKSFHTGAPSADFMNDTIAVNCQTIGSMLSMNDEAPAGDDDFDDIFDF